MSNLFFKNLWNIIISIFMLIIIALLIWIGLSNVNSKSDRPYVLKDFSL
ncbi:hypothetical protein [Spiroplasma endosymbiont of Amphibalanus improvisus]